MPLEIVPKLKLYSRSEWGADPAHPRLGVMVPRTDRDRVIFHHTVMTDTSDTSPNIWETKNEVFSMMRNLQTVRAADLGADVPYNFVVFFMRGSEGIFVCEGRGEDRRGAHTRGVNSKGIGIALAGNFHDLGTSVIDIASRIYLLSFFLGWLKYDASGPGYGNYDPMINLGNVRHSEREVFAHRDYKATACPGDEFEPHLRQVTFLRPPA